MASGDLTVRVDLGGDLALMLASLAARVEALHVKVDAIMATQAEIDQIAADVQGIATVLTEFIPRAEEEIAALKAANPALDISDLETLVTQAKTKAAELDAIPTPDVPSGP